jgi:glycosyltransferase involved in cell wall biosynthesis
MEGSMRERVIVCCSPFGEDWSWFVAELTDRDTRWKFYSDRPRYFWQKYFQRPNLNTPIAGLRAAWSAKIHRAQLMVSMDPRVTLWCALFCRLLQVRIEHLVFSFNFAELPRGWKRRVFSFAFQQVDRIRVHSKMEVALYSNYFGIPEGRIHVGLWCMNPPEVSPDDALQSGDYACAIGGNARDYQTLLKACERTPEIPMVWVVRPENLAGLTIPPHVRVICNVPYKEAMNVLKYSKFMVLPLKSAETPCGHVTIVSGMYLQKAIVVTDSAGVSDYVEEGRNGIRCRAGDAAQLAEAMRTLWVDTNLAEQFGENALQFAEQYCSEANVRREMMAYFRERCLLTEESVEISTPVEA